MIVLRILAAVGGLALVGLIVWAMGADDRGLGVVLSEMMREPWSVVPLSDLYLGFFIAAAVIVLFERRLWVGLLWAVPVFFLGNVVTAAWLVVRAPALAARLRPSA